MEETILQQTDLMFCTFMTFNSLKKNCRGLSLNQKCLNKEYMFKNCVESMAEFHNLQETKNNLVLKAIQSCKNFFN